MVLKTVEKLPAKPELAQSRVHLRKELVWYFLIEY